MFEINEMSTLSVGIFLPSGVDGYRESAKVHNLNSRHDRYNADSTGFILQKQQECGVPAT